MTHAQNHSPARRAFVGLIVAVGIAGLASQATARGDASPADTVPRHYSIETFTSLDRNEVYRIDHAARHGSRSITIGDFSASESRKILREAVADWPATRATLLR